MSVNSENKNLFISSTTRGISELNKFFAKRLKFICVHSLEFQMSAGVI